MNSLTSLFKPGNIGAMELRNRIIMAPMGGLLANEDGTINERVVRYYEEVAKGGVGLVIQEITAVSPEGSGHPAQLKIYGDQFIPGCKRLVDTVASPRSARGDATVSCGKTEGAWACENPACCSIGNSFAFLENHAT